MLPEGLTSWPQTNSLISPNVSFRMSTDFVNLLNVISPESPGGDPHVYSRQLRESLTSLRKPESPNGDDDSSYRRSADWNSIVELSTSALTEQTKDLRIVCHLVEAWTQIRGFSGLADGLSLLTEFVETCWQRCNPPIDDGDLEVRTAPLENMLDDPDRGICFPTTIRQISFLGDASHGCNYLKQQQLHQSSDEQDNQVLEQIIQSTDPESFRQITLDIDNALNNLTQLKSALDQELGSQAPGLTYLKSAISDCQRVARHYASRLLPADCDPDSTACDESPRDPSTNTNATNTNNSSLSSRADAYRRLTEVAEFLQKTEPHSPIPYLVHRAVTLGQLPFPQLMQQLVREEGILNELRREFGINEGTES